MAGFRFGTGTSYIAFGEPSSCTADPSTFARSFLARFDPAPSRPAFQGGRTTSSSAAHCGNCGDVPHVQALGTTRCQDSHSVAPVGHRVQHDCAVGHSLLQRAHDQPLDRRGNTMDLGFPLAVSLCGRHHLVHHAQLDPTLRTDAVVDFGPGIGHHGRHLQPLAGSTADPDQDQGAGHSRPHCRTPSRLAATGAPHHRIAAA